MKKFWQLVSKRHLVFGIVLFALVIGTSVVEAENKVKVEFGEAAVDIIAKRYSMNIPYDMVDSIELTPMPDPGEIIEGRDDMSIRYGTWINDVWGEYAVCADLGASNAIAVHLNDGQIFVFSRKSDAETQSIYETFQLHLNP